MTAMPSVVAAPLDTTSIERPNRMNAPVRVFQVATGNVGSEMIKRLGNRTDLELVGLHCYSPEKIGRDAGEIVGLPAIGVKGPASLQKILGSKPDVLTFPGVFPDE